MPKTYLEHSTCSEQGKFWLNIVPRTGCGRWVRCSQRLWASSSWSSGCYIAAGQGTKSFAMWFYCEVKRSKTYQAMLRAAEDYHVQCHAAIPNGPSAEHYSESWRVGRLEVVDALSRGGALKSSGPHEGDSAEGLVREYRGSGSLRASKSCRII